MGGARPRAYLRLSCRLLATLVLGVSGIGAARAQSAEDLSRMSISQLGEIDVSSVTKTPQSLSDAPAAIYVITHDDILRSGATSVPEMLRLAPNLQVARTGSSQYVITARGLSGNSAAQNFSNKLLVLIDGRSVYTPLYSGVYWDMQDVLPADVDRIEVISGPGATLWGANAVNGVINIVTRASGDTQGLLVDATAGALERTGGLRYGGRIGDDATFRIYARGVDQDQTLTATGAHGGDDAWRVQGGFRLDWAPGERDRLTLQGDAYGGAHGQLGGADEDINGRNLLVRWHRVGAGSDLQVQAYYDRTSRMTEQGGGRFSLDTYDLDIQHRFALGESNAMVVGGGVRANSYQIDGPPSLLFAPPHRTLLLASAFVQDTVKLDSRLNLTVGLKLEDEPYSGTVLLPSARLAWKPVPEALFWTAVSRAIRSPTPFDRDVVETLGTTVFLTGVDSFTTEKLTAYEVGLRVQPGERFSLSVSGFYNVYDDLRSIEVAPGGFLPLQWGNGLKGNTWGFESWADFELLSWWKLSAGFSLLKEDFHFKSGASGILGVAQLGSDPDHRAALRSSMNLGSGVTLDADLRQVGRRPDPYVPPFLELGGRLGWNIDDRITLAVSAFNLLHARHQEFPATQADAVPRQVVAGLQWRL
ncbi:MAG: TonB-dependent receptor [Sphingomonas bacterium]|uniref:TonB-dependent receptor plug domain-containing protein n=1 Tax=Sphingomonas bacterium TaxID=1895847 RepID=UPI0026285265|nr:TonB-dependent receptor [Sphingomonas bacterium]MDB5703943.1 TonB-dependent receptor [Sphingomonas bacterium]